MMTADPILLFCNKAMSELCHINVKCSSFLDFSTNNLSFFQSLLNLFLLLIISILLLFVVFSFSVCNIKKICIS